MKKQPTNHEIRTRIAPILFGEQTPQQREKYIERIKKEYLGLHDVWMAEVKQRLERRKV